MAQAPTPPEQTVAATGDALQKEARFSLAVLRVHGWRLALVFLGLLLPMWGFGELADEIHGQDAIPFDEPVLRYAHSLAGQGRDRMFLIVSKLGYSHGVVPFAVALVIGLAARRHFREATFALFALGGSGLLNMATKRLFSRERPALWESLAPESTFSFPSGHAMGSATLAVVLILLAWRTRWRWPVTLAMLAFAAVVGFSRVYLGVHYPSDILAGWAGASVWAAAMFLLIFRFHRHPWRGPEPVTRPVSPPR